MTDKQFWKQFIKFMPGGQHIYLKEYFDRNLAYYGVTGQNNIIALDKFLAQTMYNVHTSTLDEPKKKLIKS